MHGMINFFRFNIFTDQFIQLVGCLFEYNLIWMIVISCLLRLTVRLAKCQMSLIRFLVLISTCRTLGIKLKPLVNTQFVKLVSTVVILEKHVHEYLIRYDLDD